MTWPPTRLCPATANLPTRMTAPSWRALCASTQGRASRSRGDYRESLKEERSAVWAALNPCHDCQGNARPPGLEIISLEEKQEMATSSSKIGICDACGNKAPLQGNRGEKVCSSCVNIRSQIANRPEAVAAAARSLHKTSELIELLVGPAATHQLTSEAESGALRSIAGIVGYDGTCGDELVEAVRRVAIRDLGREDCDECDAALALIEISDLIGKKGADCGVVVDTLRALEDDARYQRCQYAELLTQFKEEQRAVDRLRQQQEQHENEIARLNGTTNSDAEQVTALRGDLDRSTKVIEALRKELAEEQKNVKRLRSNNADVEAENMDLEAECQRLRGLQPADIGLLDVALAVIREEPVPAGKIASLIDAARGRAK